MAIGCPPKWKCTEPKRTAVQCILGNGIEAERFNQHLIHHAQVCSDRGLVWSAGESHVIVAHRMCQGSLKKHTSSNIHACVSKCLTSTISQEVDSPFFSTIVLFKIRSVSPEFLRFPEKKDPWKEWKWKVPREFPSCPAISRTSTKYVLHLTSPNMVKGLSKGSL